MSGLNVKIIMDDDNDEDDDDDNHSMNNNANNTTNTIYNTDNTNNDDNNDVNLSWGESHYKGAIQCLQCTLHVSCFVKYVLNQFYSDQLLANFILYLTV